MGSDPLALALTPVDRLALESCHRSARDRPRLAPPRLPALLAMEIHAKPGRPFSVVVRTLISPCSGRDFDRRTSSTSLSTRSSSPGRTGRGQRNSSKPAPTMPPAGLSSLSTRSRMVTAAVCQPLAARPRKMVSRAASSSRWKGGGSKSAAKVLTRMVSFPSASGRHTSKAQPRSGKTPNERLSGARAATAAAGTRPSCASPLQPLVGGPTTNGARRPCNPSTGHRISLPDTALPSE